jgi:hypothetical protein
MATSPAAVVAWLLVVAAGTVLGLVLLRLGVKIVLPTPPVLGQWRWGWPPGLVIAGIAGCALAVLLPATADGTRWRVTLVVTSLAALGWWLALSLADGTGGLVRGPRWSTEYLHDVPAVRDDPGRFLRTFTDAIGQYEIHVRGHPPGMVLLLAGLDRVGLKGAGGEVVVVLTAAATAPVAILIAIREVVGEAIARRAAPFVALAPAAIWIATSADALYMAVVAWAVACVALASGRRGPASFALAAGGGLLGGLALLGSYGMLLAALIPAPVLWRRRRADTSLVAGSFAVVVLAAMLPFGFSWLQGLAATRHEYEILDLDRPYLAFLVINTAAWALALGPATAAAFATSRDSRLWRIVSGGVAAAALANVSGLSKGEVERIWLPFGIWVLPIGAALATTHRRSTRWLLAQVATAIAVVAVVRTQW